MFFGNILFRRLTCMIELLPMRKKNSRLLVSRGRRKRNWNSTLRINHSTARSLGVARTHNTRRKFPNVIQSSIDSSILCFHLLSSWLFILVSQDHVCAERVPLLIIHSRVHATKWLGIIQASLPYIAPLFFLFLGTRQGKVGADKLRGSFA